MTTWDVSNTCEGAFKEDDNGTVFQGPNVKRRERLDCQFRREKVASSLRVYEGIATAITKLTELYRGRGCSCWVDQ